jgi:hypothetical protein
MSLKGLSFMSDYSNDILPSTAEYVLKSLEEMYDEIENVSDEMIVLLKEDKAK